jgi:hypothetical protein
MVSDKYEEQGALGAYTMFQRAPYPNALEYLVNCLIYKDGWRFSLTQVDRGQGSEGLTLMIHVQTVNSYPPHETLGVMHYMPVPPAAYDARSWQRWLFDQIMLVELHEAMEFFTIEDSDSLIAPGSNKPYAPSHGPGNDPYMLREVGTDEDRRTSFRGELT